MPIWPSHKFEETSLREFKLWKFMIAWIHLNKKDFSKIPLQTNKQTKKTINS